MSKLRAELLFKVIEPRNFLNRLKEDNEDNSFVLQQIHKFNEALDFVEQYAENSNLKFLDTTRFNKVGHEISDELRSLKNIINEIYSINAELEVFAKCLYAEESLVYRQNSNEYFERLNKIINTSNRLFKENLNMLVSDIRKKYSKNIKSTGKELHDDYSKILLGEETEHWLKVINNSIDNSKIGLEEFGEEVKQLRQENFDYEKDAELLKLIDATSEEFKNVNNSDYDASIVHKLSNLAQELELQSVRRSNILEDQEKQRDSFIFKMEQLKEELYKFKTIVLEEEMFTHLDLAKEYFHRLQDISPDIVENVEMYGNFLCRHLDSFLNTFVKLQADTTDSITEEIEDEKIKITKFVKMCNLARAKEIEQQINQEQERSI